MNARCLDPATIEAIDVETFDGRNGALQRRKVQRDAKPCQAGSLKESAFIHGQAREERLDAYYK